MRSSLRIKGVIVDINGEGEISCPWVGSRVRSTCEVGLLLVFGSGSDVRASARITFRLKVKCG